MNSIYDDSCTPWDTPNLDFSYHNYLKKPPEIRLNSFDRNAINLNNLSMPVKQSKNCFIQRNKINSKNSQRKNLQKQQIKKSHQSLHFQRVFHNRSAVQLHEQSQKKQTLHTLINFAIKRKSLKQKIQRTKKLLEKNQSNRVQDMRTKSKEHKQIQESFQKLLSLNKTSSQHNFINSTSSINTASIDSFFQMKKTLSTNIRNKNTCTQHSKKGKQQVEKNNLNIFLESKTNAIYLKKRANNKTFYKSTKYEKSMNLPKISMFDWQKPQF